MRNKVKLRNPGDLKVGTKIKIPIDGRWFYRTGLVWFKGTIIKVAPPRDGKIRCVVISLRPNKRFGKILGRTMSLSEQCDNIYKVK